MTRWGWWAIVWVGLVTACGRKPPAPAADEARLVVFGAASLREAFETLGDSFRRAHPGTEVVFNFAGTQQLRVQLEHGAAADLFAAADERHMDELARADRVESPWVFALNEPVVVAALPHGPGAPRVQTFADLPKAGRIVIGAAEVPIGRYTMEVLDRAGPLLGSDFRTRVEAHVVSRELNVRQVLGKVSLGEADAGVVYRTDAKTVKDGITIVTIPPSINVVAKYPIASVKSAAHPRLARAWLDLLRSAEGRAILADRGFTLPSVGSDP